MISIHPERLIDEIKPFMIKKKEEKLSKLGKERNFIQLRASTQRPMGGLQG